MFAKVINEINIENIAKDQVKGSINKILNMPGGAREGY